MVAKIVAVTVNLLRFRGGPQDLAVDQTLLWTLGFIYFTVSFAQILVASPTNVAMVQALATTVLLAFYVGAVLRIRGRTVRYAQTLAAIYAVGIVFTLLMLGPSASLAPYINSMVEGADAQAAAGQSPPLLGVLAAMVIEIWRLVVVGHVYRNALDTGLGFGVLWALGFKLLLLFVLSFISAFLVPLF